MKYITVILAAAAIFWLGRHAHGADGEGQVSGEVFIASAGGQSYRLALVKVMLFPAEQFQAYVAQKKDAADGFRKQLEPVLANVERAEKEANKKEKDAFDKILAGGDFSFEAEDARRKAHDKANVEMVTAVSAASAIRAKVWFLDSATYYFYELPQPIRSVATNSDGRYSLPVPKDGKFVVVAEASRQLQERVERYYWAINVDLAGSAEMALTLANDNMTNKGAADSALLTKYSNIQGR